MCYIGCGYAQSACSKKDLISFNKTSVAIPYTPCIHIVEFVFITNHDTCAKLIHMDMFASLYKVKQSVIFFPCIESIS
jgi:hypothetical protein